MSVEWVGSRNLVPQLQGPVVDFRSFLSGRGIMLNYDLPGQPALANSFLVQYQRTGAPQSGKAALADATGWTNVPASFSTAKEAAFDLISTSVANDVYNVYIYDSTNDSTENYDRILVTNAPSKDGNDEVANLAAGEWADIKVTLLGPDGGLLPEGDRDRARPVEVPRLLHVDRACERIVQRARPGRFGRVRGDAQRGLPSSTAADFAPLEALIIDEDTYVEQGLFWKDAHWAYLNYIFDDLGVDPDLLLLGAPTTDEFQHQFLGLTVPTDMDGDPNPYFDNVDGTGPPDGRTAIREGYIRSAYHEADNTLDLGRDLMGSNSTVFASSDHGFAPQWLAVNTNKVLNDATVLNTVTNLPVSLHASSESAQNCNNPFGGPSIATDLTKSCWAGGTTQIYVNPTLPAGITYEAVRNAVVAAFENLTDPANPGKQVVTDAMKKEELRNVDGSDSLHPNRSGDVVVVFRPPYQTDAATPGVTIAFSQFFGQHGYLPDLVDLPHSVNMHSTFVASGPGIRKQGPVPGIRQVDVAPTIAFLMGIPGPQNARGKILYQLFPNPGRLKEVTILDISDWHGQIVPLTDVSDNLAAPLVNPVFPIGGSAFLKPWFDVYRAEAEAGHMTVAAGDSVGATPPIASFFGDTPVFPFMNKMGITADGLGNHNFDKGQAYLRNTLIPLANFPFLSANVVDANGNTPAEWSPSKTFNFPGFKLGLVGFTNEDAPGLVFPGSFDPFHVDPRLPRVQAAVNALKSKKIDTIVVMGHDGATAGTLNNPTGPLIDLADQLVNVDAVVGDHSDFQVITTRPNGVLVTENRSKGIRFTRIRLVVDPSTKEVVYKTADFHRPWNIGVTPDPSIQADINALNAQLQPILGTVIGQSNVAVPGRTPARSRPVALTAARASPWSATSSPIRCGTRTGRTSRSRTRAA